MSHLTINDRIKIELMLKSGSLLSKIAKEIKKANSTISHVCNKRYSHYRKKYCSLYNDCNDVCSDFIEEKCSKLFHSPYVYYTEFGIMCAMDVNN